MVLDALAAVAGALLVFVVPGLALNRALFPDWRFRGPSGTARVVETGVMSLFGSVALTVVVGSALAAGPGLTFQASWRDPELEAVLGVLSAALFAVAALRGAFRRDPPVPPATETAPAEFDGWSRLREFSAVEERLRAARRAFIGAPSSEEQDRWRAEVRRLEGEREELRRRREVEFERA